MFFEQYPPPLGTVVESDKISLKPLLGQRIAIIGYGTMGRAHAQNLRISGLSVVVGSRAGSKTGDLARAEGFEVFSVSEACTTADIVMLMLPDESMADVYRTVVAPAIGSLTILGFAHGFALAFDQIVPEAGQPVFLAAPKGQGDMLLAAFKEGSGVPGLLAVTETSPEATWDVAAAYALAVGCLVGGGFVTTFRHECISDQFGEQVVLCGGVVELVKAAFEIMVEAGYSEENAYFECVHELKLITDLMHRYGIDGMRSRISGTASYGGLTRGRRVIDEHVRQNMRDILTEIESGVFAQELLARHDDVNVGIAALAQKEKECPLVKVGQRVLPRLHPEPM